MLSPLSYLLLSHNTVLHLLPIYYSFTCSSLVFQCPTTIIITTFIQNMSKITTKNCTFADFTAEHLQFCTYFCNSLIFISCATCLYVVRLFARRVSFYYTFIGVSDIYLYYVYAITLYISYILIFYHSIFSYNMSATISIHTLIALNVSLSFI